MGAGNVGVLREQCALNDANDPVVVRLVRADRTVSYYKVRRSWPDTSQAPAGKAFYVEFHEEDLILDIR